MVLVAACEWESAKPVVASATTATVRAAQKQPLVQDWWVPTCGNVLPLQVGHDVTPPVTIKRVEPTFPRHLHSRGLQGVVIIQIVITDSGRVCAARVEKTFEGSIGSEIAASALEAVKQWQFRPAKLNGKPRACGYTLTVRVHPLIIGQWNAGVSPAERAPSRRHRRIDAGGDVR